MNRLVIQELRLNGRTCPLGVDEIDVAFSWSFAPTIQRLQFQTAYRILVSTRQERLAAATGDVWDSGKVTSANCSEVLYEGAPLKSRVRYHWQLTVWDQDGRPSESVTSWWETGLLSAEDWQARWIGEPSRNEADRRPLPLLRREFTVSKPVARGRAYICGLGHYELRLNGAKVGDSVLDPGWTNYDQTCLYTVFDITERLKEGCNAAGVLLGNGFFNVEGGRYTKFKDSFGKPKCLVQLELQYEDGTSEMIVSDRTWKTSGGPIVFSCIYGGEDYDARLEQPGWDLPGFDGDASWTEAAEVAAAAGVLRAQASPPLMVMKRFEPVDVTEPKPGVYVLDLGQNFSGWVELNVAGPAGSKVVLTPAERLKDDGLPNQKQSGSPYKFTYILKGGVEERWSPRFSYYGFRYVGIEGAVPAGRSAAADPEFPVLLGLEGQMIYPDMKTAGGLKTSDQMLNRIHEIIHWAILSNTKSIFTDCPHREKLGWLEEVHLMGPSIMYNCDVQALMVKVMEDIRDAQLPGGMVPTTAPEYVVFSEPWDIFRHSVPWGGAYILIGWELYRRYGNRRTLAGHYDGMKRYIDYIGTTADDGIVTGGLGDWYDVGPEKPGFSQNTPVSLVETAFYYHLLTVMERIAALLGHASDRQRFCQLGGAVKKAFNNFYFDRETGCYATGSQTAQAVPLVFGLAAEMDRSRVFQRLVEDVVSRGCRITAGDVGHRYVLIALARYGRADLICRMARNTDSPGYGYQVARGATTLTEAWDGPTVGASQNHLMLGHLDEWFYAGMAGIEYVYEPKSERFVLEFKPQPAAGLQKAEAWHELRAGRAAISWEKEEEGGILLKVTIPPNTTAYIHVPSSSAESVKESGCAVRDMRGVTFVRFADGAAVFYAGSGEYSFTGGGVH
ncbi:family 78 glycoside hydrolase catalytic domain [Paenibacillus tarimensis]